MICVSGSSCKARCTCANDNASPPMINCRTPARLWGDSSITTLNNEAVNHNVVTCSSASTRRICSTCGTGSGNRTQRPPCKRGAQISNVDASKQIDDKCKIDSRWPNLTYSTPNNKRTILRWQISVPFGWPVEPEVYITYARLSAEVVLHRFSADDPVSLLLERGSPRSKRGTSGSRSVRSRWVSTTLTCESRIMNSSRSRG